MGRSGAHNIPDRLLIPEKLYGRVREIGNHARIFRKGSSFREDVPGIGDNARRPEK